MACINMSSIEMHAYIQRENEHSNETQSFEAKLKILRNAKKTNGVIYT